ncbi:MAG: transcriptional regulator NrdR [Fimbriimonadales bacterium]
MRCPYCGYAEDKVIESRTAREGAAIRRRRECLECGRRYTTFEEIEERRPMVVKKDGRREPYGRQKIEQSIEIACRKRPVPTSIIAMAAEEIERALFESPEQEIASERIGEMVLEKLQEIDPVAYVRFASVYREFEDPAEFGDFVSALMQASKKRKNASVGR